MTDLPIPHSVGSTQGCFYLYVHFFLIFFFFIYLFFGSIYAILLVDVTTLVYIMSSAVKI